MKHGVPSGIKEHTRRGEPPCNECRLAANQYQRDRYAARGRPGRPAVVPPPSGQRPVVIDDPMLELTGNGCGPWARKAACLDKPSDWFFPDSPTVITTEARALCGTCPVQPECLDHAVRTGEFHGTWGGRSEAQLARLRSTLRRGATA